MEKKMDIDYLRQKSDFHEFQAKNIVYRINKYAGLYGSFVYGNERIASSWGLCCEYCANKVNYRQTIPEKPVDLWKAVEMNCVHKTNKAANNWNSRWETKAYFILEWMNITWPDDSFDMNKRLFQPTVNRGVTNINDRASTSRGNSRRKIPDTWSETVRKASVGIRDFSLGKNSCKQDSDFHAVILKSQVDFRRDLDGLWKTCYERINFE